MKKALLTLTAIAALAGSASAQALTPGDLFIIGFRSDASDAFAFVPWVDINAGTSISFTDSGFFDDGTLRDSENVSNWTAPTGGITAGTVVVIADGSPDSADAGTIDSALGGISSSGDQIFAGTTTFPSNGDTTKPGSTYTGTVIFGINFNSTDFASDTSSTADSTRPSDLDGDSSIAFLEVDNAQYTGPRTGLDIAGYKSAILNLSNWSSDNSGSAFGALDSTDFSIIPEPAALSGFFGLAALLVARRRA